MEQSPRWESLSLQFSKSMCYKNGVALEKSKVDLSSFRGARCWFDHNPRHILRAQELADWISKKYTI
ncbi:hypothetical protein, partial [Elizabethkingia argenteiflava]|uniref:hypothetical protein n=1 Tax=Elizabethkingia argenteiflava TaxID=2681556 RepID=UPI001BB38E70